MTYDPIHEYAIPDSDVETAIDLMQLLLRGFEAGGATLIDGSAPEQAPLQLSPTLIEPLLELLALLATKRRGYLMVLDGHDEISKMEAGRLLGLSFEDLGKVSAAKAIPSKRKGHYELFAMSDVLKRVGGRLDEETKQWVMPEDRSTISMVPKYGVRARPNARRSKRSRHLGADDRGSAPKM